MFIPIMESHISLFLYNKLCHALLIGSAIAASER